jgi:hypothetical protein
MKSLSPNSMGVKTQNPSLPEQTFQKRGIRMHRDISAKAIGARTPSEMNAQAQQVARITDPVVGPAVPQDRIARYGSDIGA